MIEFPSWLEWLGAAIGMEWPHGNEDEMWALAGDWHTAADELREILHLMDEAKSATLAAYPAGDGRQQMSDTFDGMRTGKDSLEALAGYFDQIGDSVDGGGTQIQYTKLMFYSTLVITAADIAAVWIFPPTAPAEEAGIIIATRVAVRMMFRRMLTAMAGWAGRLAENAVVRFLFRHVLLNAALGALQDFAVQEFQVWQGHRKGLDWNQLGVTTFAAGVGGAAGGGFGEALGRKFGNAFRNEAGDITSKWGVNLTRAGIGAGSGLVNSAAAFGGSVGWQFASDLAHGDLGTALDNLKHTHVDWRMFSAGAITGGGSALNHNFAHSHFENSPFWKLNAPRADLGTIGGLDTFQHDGTVPNVHADVPNGNGVAPHGNTRAVHGDPGAPGPGPVRGEPVSNGHDSRAGAPTTTAGAHQPPASGAGPAPEHSAPQDHSESSPPSPRTSAQDRSGPVDSSAPPESTASAGPAVHDSPSMPVTNHPGGAGHDATPAVTSDTPVSHPGAHETGTGAASSGPESPPPSQADTPGASTPGASAASGPGTSAGAGTGASPIDARGASPVGGSEAPRTGAGRGADARVGGDGRPASDLNRGTGAGDGRTPARAGSADASGARPAVDSRVQARVTDSESSRGGGRAGASEGERVTAEPGRAEAGSTRERATGSRADRGPGAESRRGTGEQHERAGAPDEYGESAKPRETGAEVSSPGRDVDSGRGDVRGTRNPDDAARDPGRSAPRDSDTAEPRDLEQAGERDAPRDAEGNHPGRPRAGEFGTPPAESDAHPRPVDRAGESSGPASRHDSADDAPAGTPRDDAGARPHPGHESADAGGPRPEADGAQDESGARRDSSRRRPAADGNHDGSVARPRDPETGETTARHTRDDSGRIRPEDQAVPGMPAHPADGEHTQARPRREEQPAPDHQGTPEPAKPATTRRDSTRGRCAELALRLIKDLTGSKTVRVPERTVGPEGMTAAEVQADAGGRMVKVSDHDAIARRLSRMRKGAMALVVDGYHAGPGRRVVGAHAYVMIHEGGGRIVVRDESTGVVTEHPADLPTDLHDTHMILFDRTGRPVHPLTPEQRAALAHQQDPTAVRIRQALDDHTGRVHELLLRTRTGRRILEGLTDSRYRDHVDRGAQADGRYGSFRRRDITAVVYAEGRGRIAQALTLAHESVHAERYLNGESPADRPLELSRDDYVREMVHEEAMASGRRFQLAAELRELGYDIVERPPEAAYRRACETALRGLDGPGAHEIAHEVAVDHLRDYLEHVPPNDGGTTYADHYRDIWDRAHESARTPTDESIRYVPDDPAVRDHIRSTALERHIAAVRLNEHARDLRHIADRVADRIPYDPTMRRDMVRHLISEQLRGIGRELDRGGLPPERGAELRRLAHDLRRMTDLVDRHHNALAEVDRLRSAGAAEVARQLLGDMIADDPGAVVIGDHFAVIPGEPEHILVAAGPGDHQRVMRAAPPEISERLARPGAEPEYLNVRTRDNGEIRYERIDRPDPAREEPAEHVEPQDLAARASEAIVAELQRKLNGIPVGSWAVDTLRARGVTIEHESGGGHRYEPGRNRLTLDIGGTDAEQMAALVHGAIHAERAHERGTADGVLDRDRMTRDEYVAQMVNEETAAHAMEFSALAQLREADHQIPVSSLERIYRDAFTEARERAAARDDLPGDAMARDAELDRIANEAGIEAIRPAVADHAPDAVQRAQPPPEPDGSSYVNTYGGDTAYGIKGWVDEHGILHYEIRVGPDTPSGREMFQDLMNELGDRVEGIQDEWYGGGALTDNLDSFNAGVQDGFTPEEAARRTFTGMLAEELGYTEVSFGDPDLRGDTGLDGPLGENTGVTVVFRHPDASGVAPDTDRQSGTSDPTNPHDPENSAARDDPGEEIAAEPPRRAEVVVDFGGEQVRLRMVADERGNWRVESAEPVELGQRAPGAEVEPAGPGRLRSLWQRLTGGYEGHNPKYPSGSGQDGKYQTELTEDFGHLFDIHALETLGDHDISINYARLLKESVTLWINREHAPLLNRLTARMELQAGEHIPMHARDGREYAYWNDDADPAEVAAMHKYLRDVGLGHLVDESMPRDLPENPAQQGESPAPHDNPADELRAAADRLGIDLTDLSPETLRRALDTAEYQNLRRAAVIEALRDAAHRYNAEHADIPYRPQSISDHNPLGRFLKEVIIAQGDDPGMLNWRGVNNGAESGRDFDVLNVENPDERIEYDPEDESGRDQGLKVYFENSLRRDQIRDERATWADLLAAELSRLEPDQLDAALNELRDGVHERAGEIRDFADQVREFRKHFPAHDVRELPPPRPGEPGRLVILDVHGDHEQTLAGALDRFPGLAARLNSGEVRAEKWTVVVDADNRAHVRHLGDLDAHAISVDVEGRHVNGLLVRDADGGWRVAQHPAEPGPVAPHARTPDEIRAVRDDLARELGLDPGQITPDLIARELRANDLRALQIEALLDHARTSDAIESFHDLANARDRLAQTTGVDDARHATPEQVGERIADPRTRGALRKQQVEMLVTYYDKLSGYLKGRGEDRGRLVGARDDLVRALGGDPSDVHPSKYSKELEHTPDPLGIDPGALASLIHDRAGNRGLRDAVTDFVRALSDTDPFTNGLRFDPATDPRVFEGDVPMHDPEALQHLRAVVGDGRRLFDAPDPDEQVPPGSRPNRDWARLLGHDLTAATPEQYVRAYEAYRDGKIEKHERLDATQRDEVHRRLREEVRRRAVDLRALSELNDRYHRAVADLPQNRRAAIDRLSRDWASAWTGRERAREYITEHAHELRISAEELLSDELKDSSALDDLFDDLGARTLRGENRADFGRRFEEFTAQHEALLAATRRFHDNDVRVADLDTELRAAVERDVELSRDDGDDGDDGEGTAAAPPQGPPKRPPRAPGGAAEPPKPDAGGSDGAGAKPDGGERGEAGPDDTGGPPADPAGSGAPPRAETPAEWGLRMRAENASWSARMAARHAIRMRELADEMVARDPDGPDGSMAWDARMAADRAEWEARFAAQRADWLWDLVGDDRGPAGAAPVKPGAGEPNRDAGSGTETPERVAGAEGSAGKSEGDDPGADSVGGDDGSGGSPAKPGGDSGRPGDSGTEAGAEPAADGNDGGAPARRTWHQDGPQQEHRPVTRALRKALRDLADAGADRVRAWTRVTARAHALGLRPDLIRREMLREAIARAAAATDAAPAARAALHDLLADLDNGAARLELDHRAERLGVSLPSDHQVADAVRDRLAPPAQRRAELSIELDDRRTVDRPRLERLAREFGVDPEGLSRPELQRAVRDAVNNHREPIPERQRRATVQLVDRYRAAAANESTRRAAAQHAAERELMQLRAGFDDRGPRISGVSYRRLRFDAPGRLRADGAVGERGRWVGVGAHGDPEIRMPARERVRHATEGFDAVYFGVELDHHGRIWVSEHHPDVAEAPAARPVPARRPGDWVAGDEREHEPATRALRRQLRDLGEEIGRRDEQVEKNVAKIVQLAEHLGIDDAWRMRPRELAGAVRDLIVARRARADELWNRADIPRADLKTFFEDRRAEEARAEEAEALGKALLGLLRVHDQTLVASRDRVAADAALLAARDALAGHEGRPLGSDGRPADPKAAVARLIPGRDGAPDRLVVVAPGANPDRVLDPAVRHALLGADGEFVFRRAHVDVDGRVRLVDMHEPPAELDHAAHRRPEIEAPRPAPDPARPAPDTAPPPVSNPQAALDAKVRERAHVAADLEFWRTKVDHRAEPFGDPDLSRNHWSETLRQLRGDNTRYISDSAGLDGLDLARRERLLPEQEHEQTELVDKLAAALDRFFHFEDRLDAIDREIHELERQGARHDASLAEEVRDELGRVADEHRAAVQRVKPLRRGRDELSRLLDDPARRTPEKLRRLADAEDAVLRAEHEIDRFNDERVALTGAWPDAVADHWHAMTGDDGPPALHRLSENVWVDRGRASADDATGGRPARIVVVAGRAGFDHPDVAVRAEDPNGPRHPGDDRFDAPLLDALAVHHELAELLKDPATVIDRLMVTGELVGGDRDGAGQIRPHVDALAPVEIHRTELPAREAGRMGGDTLPFTGDTMVRWRGADGRWHDPREGQARGFRAHHPDLPPGTELDKFWQQEVDGWRLPPKGWAAFGGSDNSHIPYRQREEKMPDGFSGTLGAEPFQNMVEPLVIKLLTDHWPELSYEQILTLSEAGRAELWWHQGPGPKPEPPPGWDEEAHHGMPLDGALYTIGKRWVQLYDMARKHPWVLGPLQRRPEIGEWVRAHTNRLPDGPFDPDHPVLRKIPIVRTFRGWKGWRAGPRIDLQPPHRPWSAAEHVPPRDRVEWSTPRQDRDIARWAAVQRWADRVIGEFAHDTGDSDVHRIVDALTRARDPLLDSGDPGGARLEALNLARHPDGTPLTREQLTDRIQLVKDHLMRNEMWVRDHADPTGRLVEKTYDPLAHVADAWLRLTGIGDGDGRTSPYNEDLLLLDDAYVEAKYLADHDDATWHDADLEAARHGYDWDTNRRRLSGHLVIRDGQVLHPGELPPDAPEHDGDKTLRMSRIPYAADSAAPDPSWLSPRERWAAEILDATDVRQRFPGLPRDPVAALKQLALRGAGVRRALPAPGARDPLLDLLLRAGRVEQLADAGDPGDRLFWADRLGEPDRAVEPGRLPDTLRRLRGDVHRRLGELDEGGPGELRGGTNTVRPALDGADGRQGADRSGADPAGVGRAGGDEAGAGPLRRLGPLEQRELTTGRSEVERLATERARLTDDMARLRAERDAATGSERARAAHAYEQARERVFALTDRITDAAGPDILAAHGARPVTNRVGIVAGDHPVVIVVGLRSDGAGGSPHDAALLAAAEAHPEVAEALAHPNVEIRYLRLAVDSRGRAFVAALESPTRAPHPAQPEQQPATGRDRPPAETAAHDSCGRATEGPRGGPNRPEGADAGGRDESGAAAGPEDGGTDSGFGDRERAGSGRRPRKTYITPVPHVPHDAEFDWPDYVPERKDIDLPPPPIPPHEPPPHNPGPHNPGPHKPGEDCHGHGHGHGHGHHGPGHGSGGHQQSGHGHEGAPGRPGAHGSHDRPAAPDRPVSGRPELPVDGPDPRPNIPVPPWLSRAGSVLAPDRGLGAEPVPDPFGHAIPDAGDPLLSQRIPARPPIGHDPETGANPAPNHSDGNGRRPGDQQRPVDRPFSLGAPRGHPPDPGVPPPHPDARPRNEIPRNGFPPMAPPVPNGGHPAAGTRPARHRAHPVAPVPPPRILVQEFGGFRCAEVDPLTGSLHEVAEPTAPFSGVYSDLDGVEVVFFRTGGRLFVRVGGQLIDADDLAIIVHWQRAGRRYTELTVTRAGPAVCGVRYRRRIPQLDLGLWIRDVLDNPAHRTQIFAEAPGVP
ncbi:hypothetical protein [Nocardia spumae]|uniref:WXG100-like domain-containing protein n=1 Tax=Nocardia spumae TaxID=2887190 RepID=UPI001D138CF7|nr:hypothetical protein [Nocardia spumae]